MADVATTARYPGQAPIDAYGNGGFRFAGMSHKGSILCLPDAVIAWEPRELTAVSPESLAPVLSCRLPIDLLLLGTGATHGQPPPWLRQMLASGTIGLETMATGAAVRTWNILIAEGRPVAAALIATE